MRGQDMDLIMFLQPEYVTSGIRCAHPDDPLEFRAIIFGFSLMASIAAQAVAEIIFHGLSGDEAIMYYKEECRKYMPGPDDPRGRNRYDLNHKNNFG